MLAELTAIADVIVILFMSALLVVSSITKLRDVQGARYAVLDYQLVGPGPALVLATGFGVIELAIAVGILVAPSWGLVAAAGLCGFYALIVLTAVARRIDIDCHCGPGSEKAGPVVIGRNLVFAAASLIVAMDTPSLVDALGPINPLHSIAAGTALAIGLVAAAVARVHGQLVVSGR